MNSEWKTKRLLDIAEFNPRESLPKGEIAKKVAMDKLQPFYRDIPSYELEPYSGGVKFRNGDTIMARITPCLENGKTAKVSILEEGEIGFGSTEYIVFRAKKGTDPDYLFYLVCSPMVREPAIKSMVGSSGRQRVQTDVVQNLELECPPTYIQEKIGGILRRIDDKIALNNSINENLYQQLFALYDYYYNSTDGGEVELGALCQFQEGYVNPAQTHPEYFDGDVKWLRAVDINESFIIETSRTLTQAGFKSAKKSAYLFSPNTIAISKSGTIGRLGIVADYMCGNRAVINIAPKNPLLLPYIYAFLKSHQKEFPDLAVGSVQKNLYVSLLEPLPVKILAPDALLEFCNAGNAILSTVGNNCRENIRLAQVRDTLLPRLMTGELNVSGLDL